MSRTVRDRRSSGAGLRVLTLAAALLVAACGDAAAPGTSSADSSSTGGSVTSSPEPTTTPGTSPDAGTPTTGGTGAAGATDLTIVIDNGAGSTTTWRLTCDPVGGDHPTAGAACKALEANGEKALPPVPPDRMCTQQYGGPDKATVTGTWRGAAVNATFRKTNGCEIGRWKSMAGFLPGLNA
jgi:hypothetical protein